MKVDKYMLFKLESHEFWVPTHIYTTREAYSEHEYITFDSERHEIETEKFIGIVSFVIYPQAQFEEKTPIPNLECIKGANLLSQIGSSSYYAGLKGASLIEEDTYYRLVELEPLL
jgi:hypothetical protein